ncbi:hypothetical protein Srufu_042040 [Streptomyces libani subsp. rufus]|nr:hypothetical protein Srufu_042040 [Streptomyces libani subsp. rufus]
MADLGSTGRPRLYCKPNKPGRPVAAERARLAQELEKLAAMPPFRKTAGPATRQAIRRTLRATLNAAIAQQLITFNPAAYVELESGKRPKPLLWTEERVRRWRETDEIPGPVMVWTPAQFGAFLDAAEGDRLYAFFHLVGTRGLRRGEGVGQDWSEVDLDEGLITPAKEIVVDGWAPDQSEPKTDGSANTIALDSLNIAGAQGPGRTRSAMPLARRGKTRARSSHRKTAHGCTRRRSPRPSGGSWRPRISRRSNSVIYATLRPPSPTEAAETSTR